MGDIFGGGGRGGGISVAQPAQTTSTTTLSPEQNKLVAAQTGLFQAESPIQAALSALVGGQVVDPAAVGAAATAQGAPGPTAAAPGPLAGQLQALQVVPPEQTSLVEAIQRLSGPTATAEADIATRAVDPRILADQVDLFSNVVAPAFRSGGVTAGQPFTLDPGSGQPFGTSSRGEDLAGILTRRFSEGTMDALAKASLGQESLALTGLPLALQTALAGPQAEAGLAQQKLGTAQQRAMTPLQLAMMALGGSPLFSPGMPPGGTTTQTNIPGQATVPGTGGIGGVLGGAGAGALLTALLMMPKF